MPSLTNINTTPSIVFIGMAVFVIASLKHPSPNYIFRCQSFSVLKIPFRRHFRSKATARPHAFSIKIIGRKNFGFPTSTNALPMNVSFYITDFLQNLKPAYFFIEKIDSIFASAGNIFVSIEHICSEFLSISANAFSDPVRPLVNSTDKINDSYIPEFFTNKISKGHEAIIL